MSAGPESHDGNVAPEPAQELSDVEKPSLTSQKYLIESMVGGGAMLVFHWMRHMNLALYRYIGVDLIGALIEQSHSRFGAPNRSFLRLDINPDRLPDADPILCRDCLGHLSL